MKNFKIPEQSKSEIKSIRFPHDIYERVQKIIMDKNCTFSAFVVAAVRAVLEEIE